MSLFKGSEIYSLDAKGRVSVPAKMRKGIAPEANETFALTRGMDKCIVAYPLDEWQKYIEKFKGLNQFDNLQRFFLRVVLPWQEDVEIDAQQRITIPKRLLDFAGIDSKVKIVGMLDHLELWNPEEFDKYMNSIDESYEDVASKVMI